MPLMFVQLLASAVGAVVNGLLFGAGFAFSALLVQREWNKRVKL